MNDRIRMIRTELGLTQKQFAEKLGLKQNSISNLEKDGYTVTPQNIRAICAQFNVDEHWLRTGEGSIFHSDNNTDRNEQTLLRVYSSLSPDFRDCLIQNARNLLSLQKSLSPSNSFGSQR